MPATLAADPPKVAAPPGGSFLIRDSSPSAVLTPEDFSEIQHQIRATTRRFMDEEVNPQIPALERQDQGLMRGLIRQSGELGLLGVLVPEHYDGLELDITTQMLVCECIGTYASFSTTYGGHAGIGTMPIVFFGTEQQKEKYLPRLVAGEILGAYCLSEPHAGSDSLASRTRAELTPDGRHYVLNGQKMWISNGGWADLYTVFAKVDGERFTAFLVERAWEGVKPGAEEHKMGLRGSSTTALYLDDVRVPVENVLGEVGRGHVIAFNVLNMGRLELAAACVGGAKDLLGESARYAMQRRAFGQPIGHFGAIRQKLGDMAMETFAGEALTYRTAGMIDARLEGLSWEDLGAPRKALKAIEEYAIECSIAKVYLSEALDHVADEAVQIHGGYGYHQDYVVERGYRDSRINRIFEGTNEINRMLTAGMLFKRAAQGRLDLMGVPDASRPRAAHALADGPKSVYQEHRDRVGRAKRATLAVARLARRRLGSGLERNQEVTGALADMMMEAYAAESALLRAGRLEEAGAGVVVGDILTGFLHHTLTRLRTLGGHVIGACCTGADLDSGHKAFESLLAIRPIDMPAIRDRVAARVLEAGGFAF